jgi:hypothetical protein
VTDYYILYKMRKKCAVSECNTCSFNSEERFFKFPKNYANRPKWIRVVNRPGWAPSKYSVICSKHFNNADTAQIHLFKFAVPILRSSPECQSVLAGNNYCILFYLVIYVKTFQSFLEAITF